MRNNTNAQNVRYRSGQNLLCCSCFGRKDQAIASISYDFTNKDEPYDYVVEKLAIRKVPRSLITSERELKGPIKTAPNNSSVPGSVFTRKQNKPEVVQQVLEKPAVTFSSYYKLSSKYDTGHTSRNTDNNSHSSDEGLPYKPRPEIQLLAWDKPGRKVITEEQEQELVAHILNTHSSLFTLDTKEAVPKDPEHPPNPKMTIPPYVRAALRGKRHHFSPFHRRQVSLNLQTVDNTVDNKVVSPPLKYTTPSPNLRKELSPELKKTINALGVAQRPRFPGLPPKNRRHIGGSSTTESSEHEILEAEEVDETCTLKKVTKSSKVQKETRFTLTDSFSDDSVDDTCEFSTPKRQFSEGIIMFKDQRTKYFTVQRSSENTDDKSVLTTPMGVNNNKIGYPPPDEDVDISEFCVDDSEHTSENSQLKTPCLKWKIIIKHHLDDKKDRDKKKFVENGADSGTDSESKPYAFNSKGSSPTR